MADVIKVPNQWTLRGGDNPNESDSKRCEPFKSREFYLLEAEEKVKEIQSRRETLLTWPLLILRWKGSCEKEAESQRLQVYSQEGNGDISLSVTKQFTQNLNEHRHVFFPRASR